MIRTRTLFCAVVCIVLFVGGTAAIQAQPAAVSTTLEARSTTRTIVRFHSASLGKEVEYTALLPEPMEEGRLYPVLYLLHGAYGNHRDWSTSTPILDILNGRPLIVVNPDGSQFGWYADSPLQPESKYESFITRDLIADVDSRFPTDPKPRCRGIAGLSMGGHGALVLATRNPGLFGSASSMSGILNIRNHPKQWHLPDIFGEIDQNEANWRAYNFFDLAEKFTSAPVAILFDCGTSDTAAIEDNRQAHERLVNRAIPHTYHEFPGAHTWKYWGDRLPQHLAFHEAACRGELPAGIKLAGRDHYTSRTLAFEAENERVWNAEGSTRPVVLLGSSSFERINAARMFPGVTIANRGISGDGIGLGDRGIWHRLDSSVFQLRPRAVFILNGTNDLAQTARTGRPTAAEIAQRYGEVVSRIRDRSPDTHVFIVSCSPTRDRFARISPLIPEFNQLIRGLAERGDKMVSYVDTYTALVGEDGLLKLEFSADGLHLNDAGNEIVQRAMEPAMNSVAE